VLARTPDGRVTRLAPGATVRPGDRLQFELRAPVAGFAALIDLDARGAVTPFYPTAGRAVAVPAGPRHRSSNSVILDDAIGPEALVLLACREPLAIADIVRTARQQLAAAGNDPRKIGRLPLPCDQQSFPITKIPR
jgi:hypothetical protein